MLSDGVKRVVAVDLNNDSYIDQSEITAAVGEFAKAVSLNRDGLPCQDRTAFEADDFDYQIALNRGGNAAAIIPESSFWRADNQGDQIWTRAELESGLFNKIVRKDGETDTDNKIHISSPGGSLDVDIVL